MSSIVMDIHKYMNTYKLWTWNALIMLEESSYKCAIVIIINNNSNASATSIH